MRLVFHMAGVLFFLLLFFLARHTVRESSSWSTALSSRHTSRPRLKGAILYAGRAVEMVAAVGAFLEAVAVVVLATAW